MLKSAVSVLLIGFVLLKVHNHFMSIVVDEPEDDYDFIVVGGGTTGSVVASRLTEKHKYKVLLLEAGPESIYDPLINIPLLASLNRGRSIEWHFQTESMKPYSQIMKDNEADVMRGKVLGGTSAVNFQLYARGSMADYDSWVDHGAEGWQFKDVLPHFLKSETAEHIYPIDKDFHGYDGPLKVNYLEKMGLTKSFIGAAEELGLKHLKDHNSEDIIGVSSAQATVHRGLRQTSAKSYLYPVAHSRKEHLHIVVNAHVTKINFAVKPNGEKYAVGVEFSKNGRTRNVTAIREVILSAGAFGTPKILMLSGIGPKNQLEEHRIGVVKDLPGVGSNYQDHIFLPLNFHAKNLTRGDVASASEIIRGLPEWLISGRGWLANAGVAAANFKVSGSSLGPDLPDIQAILLPTEADPWLYNFLTSRYNYKPDVFNYKQTNERDGVFFSFFIHAVLLHPKSSGTVKLRSSNPFDTPRIDPNVYSNFDDEKTMIEGIKWVISTENTDAFKLKQARFVNTLSMCNDTIRDDNFYKCLVRSESQLYHGCCTAKLGRSTDRFAVVDPQLRVYGVERLRVADASVMPVIVSSPLQATCYMIGEKAASLILETYS